jgi:RNA polymerase sigma-70 factor, ECF subfamily
LGCSPLPELASLYLHIGKREIWSGTTTGFKIFFWRAANLYDFVASAGFMGLESIDVTHLLKAWSGGDQQALEELTPKVYLELRRMAAKYMRNERAGNTLQATALVHEVFLRLVEVDSVTWQDRAHFFAVSANMMRRILVDRARAKGMAKRGGGAVELNLDEVPEVASGSRAREIVAIDGALDALAQIDARKAKVVELRFFGGLTVEETAEVLKISPQSVMRDWKMARAWLMAELVR